MYLFFYVFIYYIISNKSTSAKINPSKKEKIYGILLDSPHLIHEEMLSQICNEVPFRCVQSLSQ